MPLGTQRLTVEPLAAGELGDGLARELADLLDRFADRQDGGDRIVVGYAEQLLDARLLGHRHRGEHAAIALVARSEQDVPDERIHRGARNDTDAVKVLVEGRHDVEVHTHDEHGARAEHGYAQMRWYLGGGDLLGGNLHGLHGIPRAFAVLGLRQVPLRTRDAQVDDRLSRRSILDHDHPDTLP